MDRTQRWQTSLEHMERMDRKPLQLDVSDSYRQFWYCFPVSSADEMTMQKAEFRYSQETNGQLPDWYFHQVYSWPKWEAGVGTDQVQSQAGPHSKTLYQNQNQTQYTNSALTL